MEPELVRNFSDGTGIWKRDSVSKNRKDNWETFVLREQEESLPLHGSQESA